MTEVMCLHYLRYWRGMRINCYNLVTLPILSCNGHSIHEVAL